MKNLKYIALFLLISFTSCEKDSDDNGPEIDETESYFMGQWNVSQFTSTDGYLTTNIGGTDYTGTFTSVGKDYNMTVVFDQTMHTVDSNDNFINVLTVDLGGTIIPYEIPMEDLDLSGTWVATESVLTVTSDEKTSTYRIIAYGENIIELEYTITNQNLVYDDINFIITATGYITLTK